MSKLNSHISNTNSFLCLSQQSEGVFKDKGSKFMAFAYPVHSELEIKDIVESLRKKYHDARHHCYAYILGKDNAKFRAVDDGEPSGSAGMPILNQIKAKNLSDTLVVVVRYFGGTLLGVGGLIHAYRNATADALYNASIIEKTIDQYFNIRFPYELMPVVMNIIKVDDLSIRNENFQEECTAQLIIPKAKTEKIQNLLIRYRSISIDSIINPE